MGVEKDGRIGGTETGSKMGGSTINEEGKIGGTTTDYDAIIMKPSSIGI